jgi:hypothetical protein
MWSIGLFFNRGQELGYIVKDREGVASVGPRCFEFLIVDLSRELLKLKCHGSRLNISFLV